MYGDPNRISQVLINLLTNAIKFTPEHGGIFLYVDKISENGNKECIRFSVADSGIGIPADKYNEIFEAFHQVDNTSTRMFGGTGLGLAISGNLVELMSGEIGLRSQPGVGSLFYFSLPIGTQSKVVSVQDTNTSIGQEQRSQLNILVTEDNKINQITISRILRNLGHQITLAENGTEAIESFRSTEFDLVLMDVQMPGMDGLEATKRIRQIEREEGGSKVPILAVTAHALPCDRDRCLEAGMDDYVSKPIRKPELAQKIQDIARQLTKP